MKTFYTLGLLVIALFALYLTATLEWPQRITGTRIDPLPALMVCAALRAPLRALTVLAVLGSLWQTSLSADPPGISMVPLFAVGVAVSLNRRAIHTRLWSARFAVGAAAGALVPLATVGTLMALGREPLLGWFSFWQLAVMSLASGLLALLFFPLLQWLDKTVENQPLAAPYDTTTLIKRTPH
ncbi:MAG TPA: hypothetical protein EYG19_07570 [Verrucomicrobia bacterium]|nr:hypothetical protein [Verrucomicrobiota bacterium]